MEHYASTILGYKLMDPEGCKEGGNDIALRFDIYKYCHEYVAEELYQKVVGSKDS